MKRITKIRIPKGQYCGKCRFYQLLHDSTDECGLTAEDLITDAFYTFRSPSCLKMFPNGAVFELKEKK